MSWFSFIKLCISPNIETVFSIRDEVYNIKPTILNSHAIVFFHHKDCEFCCIWMCRKLLTLSIC